MPKQKPGRSKQNYQTPPELLNALVHVTGRPYQVDLAADQFNHVAPSYVTEAGDSLACDWSEGEGLGADYHTFWLNPPFGNIKPFVKKASETDWRPGQMCHVLVPASVGSKWFFDHVWGKAAVTFLIGRITFVGAKGPFPKDCMLLTYGKNPDGTPIYPGLYVWKWRGR